MLLTDLCIKNYVIRTSEPQAKAAFNASAADPEKGLLPTELPPCIARLACDKYRNVTALSHGDKVRAFINNLLGMGDEHDELIDVPPAPPLAGRTAVVAPSVAPGEL